MAVRHGAEDEKFCVVMPPDFDPPLQRPQQPIGIDARILGLQRLEDFAPGRCGRSREPPIKIAGNRCERIDPGPPVACRLGPRHSRERWTPAGIFGYLALGYSFYKKYFW